MSISTARSPSMSESSAPTSRPVCGPDISVSGFVILALLAGETRGVPVFASKRKLAATPIGAAEENLMDGYVSSAKCSGRTRHIQKPGAVRDSGYVLQKRTGVSPQPVDPAAQGKFIMFAEVFDIAYFQALGFSGFKNLRESDELSIGENVPVNKRSLPVC
jgi:hypothetical protein